jgi:hypothetical protein
MTLRSMLVLGASLLACAGTVSAAPTPKPRRTPKIAHRPDVAPLPDGLKARLVELNDRPHTYPPLTVFSEAPDPSSLFQYYLLDTTAFQPNVFTTTIVGINDGTAPTATGANRDRPTIGAVRLVLEPKPGLPTDPNDPGAFIDVFTDLAGLFVINNESGWYEGWMIHDLVVPPVAALRADGTPQFGTMTQNDADAMLALGAEDATGNVFTLDGQPVRPTSPSDDFPSMQTNVVPIQVSMGAYNCLQQADCHAYWEFNQYTDWVFPEYELPFTGGFGGEFAAGRVGFLSSIVPGSGPHGTGPTGPGPTGGNDPRTFGDDPNDPRDPDRILDTSLDSLDRPMEVIDEHKEKRLRFIPSGLANEILLDVYVRRMSFEPLVSDPVLRLFDAYAAEVDRVDPNHDGVVSAIEVDLEDESDGLSNDRLFLPATAFGRFAVTREINDGLLAPRFAPSQRAWVLSGTIAPVVPAVAASTCCDDDLR